MKVADALRGVTKLGLDAAPIIYLVESHPIFLAVTVPYFAAIGNGQIEATTSTLAYTETLVKPLQTLNQALIAAFRNLLSATIGVTTLPVTVEIAEHAADLRARYNLRTSDAVLIATAIGAECDAFLTNDKTLRRVTEISIILLSDLTL